MTNAHTKASAERYGLLHISSLGWLAEYAFKRRCEIVRARARAHRKMVPWKISIQWPSEMP